LYQDVKARSNCLLINITGSFILNSTMPLPSWKIISSLLLTAATLLPARAAPLAQALPPEAACTYDQANQLNKLKRIAAAKANSRLIPAQRQVSWTEKDQTHWTISYGGCAHIGFSVTASRKRAVPMKQDAVLQQAARMAKAFWDPPDADALSAAIAAGKFEKRIAQGSTLYVIPREDYDAFEIEHGFAKGRERISIRWLRSF
jgi:hypothetical protein